jgi:hypothetical protein
MSFFSDLFEGNWGNLGTDLTHAPDSLSRHPGEIVETGAAVLAALTLGASLPESGLLAGGAEAAGALGAAEAGGGLAADLGIADIGAAAAGGLEADIGAGTADALAFFGGGGADALGSAGGLSSFAGDAFASDPGLTAIDSAFGPAGGGGASNTAFWDQMASGPGIGSDVTSDPGVLSAGSGSNDGIFGTGITGKDVFKYGIGAAPLALALGMGKTSLPGQIGPAEANASALASQGSNLNAAQAATIAGMKQDLTNQWRQVLYNQGVKDISKDSRWPQIEAQIDQQTTAATQQMIQQNIQNSLVGDAQLIQIAQLQMQADQNFTNTLVNATSAFGRVVGGGNTITLKAA